MQRGVILAPSSSRCPAALSSTTIARSGAPPEGPRDMNMLRIFGRTAFAAFGIATIPAPPAQAQIRHGSVSGQVSDSLGYAIANVEVTALKVGRIAHTDSLGAFSINGLPTGTNELQFRRLAYEPVVLSMQVPPDDTAQIDVTLGIVAQRLTGVVVQANAMRVEELVQFENRRRHGMGHFITRADIEHKNPIMLSDMVRSIPGAILLPGDNGRPVLRFSRSARNNCPPQFFVDGIQVIAFGIDDMPPNDVEAMELYPGSAGLPPEFNRMQSTVVCGTVVIWSRLPGNRKPAP
jgi:hypothetical protein